MNQIPKYNCLFFVFLSFCLSFFCTSKTGQIKTAKDGAKDQDTSWMVIKEGWVGSDSFQAYTNGPASNGLEHQVSQTRARLAWLLLLDSYRLTKSDKTIAIRMAGSALLKKLGKERVIHKKENQKYYVLMILNSYSLKEAWQHSRLKIEDKFPYLQDLRKNW